MSRIAAKTDPESRNAAPRRAERTGVLVGGSGLIGGTLLHHFKHADPGAIDLLSPNSKELSLRVPDDIRAYFERVKPDFIVNCAIAAIDSDPQLTFEVNCLGSVYLARAACELGIPYIHFSSAAVMPSGHDLSEDQRLPLSAELSNYAKGKLLAEHALEHLERSQGLDYTAIRLGVVYGAHDHKIQGFHRLLFSLVERSMPLLFTRKGVEHSYTNAAKLPAFVQHLLDHRDESSGNAYHFVDPDPVPLGRLILTVRDQLGQRSPRAIHVPYAVARFLLALLAKVARLTTRLGVAARPPAEVVFLKNFYESQVLSADRLQRSGFVDPDPEATILSELPGLIRYYVRRWENLNLIEPRDGRGPDPEDRAELFLHDPEELLGRVLADQGQPFLRQCPVPGELPQVENV